MDDADRAEHEETLAKIQSRKEAFARSPFWFTFWDVLTKVVHVAFWLCFWSIVAQCTCSGCIWGKP
jgi:hypothetical protein